MTAFPSTISVPTVPLRSNVNDIRKAGQKEDIFDDVPLTMVQQESQLNEERDVSYQPSGAGKFVETSTAKSIDSAHDSGLVSRDPVANAIVSPSKTERHHDSLADIYLTGK